jgi:hypothetical protein
LVRSPTLTNSESLADVERLETGQTQLPLELRHARGLTPATPSAMAAMCSGEVPQQPPTILTNPFLRPVGDFRGQLLRRFVVAAESVRQAGIRVRRDKTIAEMRQLLDVLAQFAGTEGAVEAEAQRTDVVQRVPERFGGLPRQRPSRGVGDRAGNHHRPAPTDRLEMLFDGKQRRLGVQRVENGFDQQHVGAAFAEPAMASA